MAAVDCHEILRGAHRARAIHERTTWLALCRRCHDAMDDYGRWPVARQLALKLLVDPAHFDLATIIDIRGNGPREFEMGDIVRYLKMGDYHGV